MEVNSPAGGWSAFLERIAERWELEIAFRRRVSIALTLMTLLVMAFCLIASLMIARALLFRSTTADPALLVASQPGDIHVTFVVPPPSPYPSSGLPSPILVATTTTMPPTPAPLPGTPTATPTLAATPSPPGSSQACPPAGATASLRGMRIQDGVSPDPLIAGCQAMLIIDAPQQTYAPITIALTFNPSNPGGCTVTITAAQTDAHGHAAIPFTVPGSYCIRGSTTTRGTITVGGDSSANAEFPASG